MKTFDDILGAKPINKWDKRGLFKACEPKRSSLYSASSV